MFWGKKRFNHCLDQSLYLDTSFRDLSFTVFDTETTGFSIGAKDRVIEIGAVQVANMEVTDKTFQSFVNPMRKIPVHIIELTSIEQQQVNEAPLALEVIEQYFRFMENHDSKGWVGHCISFDVMVIKKELNRMKYTFQQPLALDTIDLIHRLFPSWDMRDLEEYAASFGTKVFTRHRALGDALTTAYLFVELLKRFEEKGMTTLGDLVKLSSRKKRQNALLF
ncbi:PolC-type DNA polymerase III [Peribacillus sp. Hz7]|uniref:3'-5' exonuclease n=1 Tax=Peribacillus sp. Hz7 TaxID=3344873 RepID=UPI0035C976F2